MWEADKVDLFETPAPMRSRGPRSVTGELTSDDLEVDRSLRPRTLDDYCGQERVRENLRVLIQAAKDRGEPLDHVIFSGPPDWARLRLPVSWQTRWVPSCTPPQDPPSSARETSLPSSLTSRKVTCSLWMRFIASTTRWKRSCIPPWKTSS